MHRSDRESHHRKSDLWDTLVAGVQNRDERALARLITRVEARTAGWQTAMKRLYPLCGNARVIGITGSPGAGKSTLVNRVAGQFAENGRTVAVIAVDPSSPFSGGALLGDRLRMQTLSTADGVFIRSMATRGALGGLCQSARDVIRILDAFGKEIILIETVGVGQDEVEVVRAADLVAVVCVPGQGDGIQALKAGIMEIADIFVVNKCDRDGADEVAADIEAMLALTLESEDAIPPVIQTSATLGKGVDRLIAAMNTHLAKRAKNEAQRRQRMKEEILSLLDQAISRQVRALSGENGKVDAVVARVLSGDSDPYSAAMELFPMVKDGWPESHHPNGKG